MTELAREQKEALNQFIHLSNRFRYVQSNISRKQGLLPSGFVLASCSPTKLCEIPREKTWIWNQSNKKITVRLDAFTLVTLRKISPRKKYSNLVAPSFKIWLFHQQTTNQEDRYYMWCEKGVEEYKTPTGVYTEIGTVYPHQLTIESLSFLKPFAETKLAEELGW